MLRVRRPSEVVVLNSCVTDTNVTFIAPTCLFQLKTRFSSEIVLSWFRVLSSGRRKAPAKVFAPPAVRLGWPAPPKKTVMLPHLLPSDPMRLPEPQTPKTGDVQAVTAELRLAGSTW